MKRWKTLNRRICRQKARAKKWTLNIFGISKFYPICDIGSRCPEMEKLVFTVLKESGEFSLILESAQLLIKKWFLQDGGCCCFLGQSCSSASLHDSDYFFP